MKAIGYTHSHAIDNPQSLIDFTIEKPMATGHDCLIKVHAISVNPVDCKVRMRRASDDGTPIVLGWDAVGEVVAIGEKVEQCKIGDQVFYAGDLNRPGCNAEYQLVDARLVGKKPSNLSNAESAALPLTTITAWELLFDHMCIPLNDDSEQSARNHVILVVGAAGGVGSILIQLAKVMTDATIIATASRPQSQAWVKQLGADHVIDHSQPLVPQIKALACQVTHVAGLNQTDAYFDEYIELLPPFGKIVIIDDPKEIDVLKIKPKSLSFHIEFMFARSLYKTADMAKQGELLNQVSNLLEEGKIKTTLGKILGRINAENLRKAHQEIESGKSVGKIVLEGF